MIGLLLVGTATKLHWLATDPFWELMSESRVLAQAMDVGLMMFALIVVFGLWRRHEWARILGASLCFIVIFKSVGIPLLQPLLTPEIRIPIEWDAVIMGSLAILCFVGLIWVKFSK